MQLEIISCNTARSSLVATSSCCLAQLSLGCAFLFSIKTTKKIIRRVFSGGGVLLHSGDGRCVAEAPKPHLVLSFLLYPFPTSRLLMSSVRAACLTSPIPRPSSATFCSLACPDMASVAAFSGAVAPVAAPAASTSSSTKSSQIVSISAGLRVSGLSGKSDWQLRTQTNCSRVSCMLVWEPYNNKKFETLSYLPLLPQDSLAKQIDYLIANKWHPCIEFDVSDSVSRENSQMPGYYDGRYWTMWKLPMFGCTDPSQVLREVAECKAQYGDKCYIRVLGFDNKRQVQCAMFIVHRPGQ